MVNTYYWLGILLLAIAISGFIGYRIGNNTAEVRNGKLVQTTLRELEFRDGLRADSYKTRNVTMSGSKNMGRSRVRKARIRR